MNAVRNDASDLIFRVIDESDHATLIPVKTSTCKLSKQDTEDNQVMCAVSRDDNGAILNVLSGDVLVNGNAVQKVRLMRGDRISLGNSTYEIHQLGTFSPSESPKAEAFKINSSEIDSRFGEIRSELDRQTKNFELINSRFDEITGQISQLVEAIQSESNGSHPQPQPASDCDEIGYTESLGSQESDATRGDEAQAEPGDDGSFAAQTSNQLDETWPTIQQHDSDRLVDENDPVVESNDSSEPLTAADILTEPEPELDSTEQSTLQNPELFESAEQQLSEADILTETETGEEAIAQPTTNDQDAVDSGEQQENVADVLTGLDSDCDATGQSTTTQNHDSANEYNDLMNRLSNLTENGEENFVDTQVDDQSNEESFVAANDEACDSQSTESLANSEGNLEQLLASLNNIPAGQNPSEPTDNEAVVTTPNTESSETQLADESSIVQDSDSNTAATTSDEQLESLFASLRASENQVSSHGEAAESFENNNDSDISTESPDVVAQYNASIEAFENSIEPNSTDGTAETFDDDSNSSFSDSTEQSQSNTEHLDSGLQSVDEEDSQLANEKKLLEQLRSIQSEQLQMENEAIQADNDVFDESEIETPDVEPDTQSVTSSQVADVFANQMDASHADAETTQPTDQLQTTQDQPTESQQQESVSDLLERMNCMPDLEAASEADETAVSLPEPQSSVAPPSEPVATKTQNEENGADVQDYMNSLLQRLNSSGAAPSVASVSTTEETQNAALETAPTTELPQADAAEQVAPLNPEEFVPKQVAPEINSNLAAMRELANATSRSAVETSQMKRQQDAANLLLIGAAGAIIAAVCTTFMSKSAGDTFYWLSMAFFALTAICSGVYAKNVIFGNSSKSSGSEKKQQSKSKFDLLSFVQPIINKLRRTPEADK